MGGAPCFNGCGWPDYCDGAGSLPLRCSSGILGGEATSPAPAAAGSPLLIRLAIAPPDGRGRAQPASRARSASDRLLIGHHPGPRTSASGTAARSSDSETAPNVARARRKARGDGQNWDRRSTAWSSRAPANEPEPEARRAERVEARSGDAASTRSKARRPPGGGGWSAPNLIMRSRIVAAKPRCRQCRPASGSIEERAIRGATFNCS